MNKIKYIIFGYACFDWILSFVLFLLMMNVSQKYTKDSVLSFMFSLAVFISMKSMFYLFKTPLLDRIFNNIENIETLSFQLKDILIRPVGEECLMILTFISLGKELKLKVKTNKKYGVYKEITYGTVRLKVGKFYSIAFFIKQYVSEKDSYSYYKEPVSIDHYRIPDFEDFNIKENKKIRPSLYLIK